MHPCSCSSRPCRLHSALRTRYSYGGGRGDTGATLCTAKVGARYTRLCRSWKLLADHTLFILCLGSARRFFQVEVTSGMPVCVHCARPTPALLATFGSGHVVLTRCGYDTKGREGCARLADPYFEHGSTILFIDLVRAATHPDPVQAARIPPYPVQPRTQRS